MTEAQLAELLKTISNEVNGRKPGQFTTADVAGVMDCGGDRARKTCKQMLAEGKIRPTYVVTKSIWGNAQRVQGWELVEK